MWKDMLHCDHNYWQEIWKTSYNQEQYSLITLKIIHSNS